MLSGLRHDQLESPSAEHESLDGRHLHGSEHAHGAYNDDDQLVIDDSTLPEAVANADLVLNDLAKLAALIRRAGTTSRLNKADKTFDPRAHKHSELRIHLVQLILSRPTHLECLRNTHWDSIDPSLADLDPSGKDAYWSRVDQETVSFSQHHNAITAIQDRLIVANLRRSHRFAYSQKHGRKLETSSQHFARFGDTGEQTTTESGTGFSVWKPKATSDAKAHDAKAHDANQQQQLESNEMETPDYGAETMTDTVASDVETIVINELAKLPTPSQQAVTEISTTGSRLRYPRPPRCNEGAGLFRCPCCCAPLPAIFADARRWRYVQLTAGYI